MQPLSVELCEQMLADAMARQDWPAVEVYAATLDELTPPKEPVPLASAALWYAEQGLRVFPLQYHSKVPYAGTNGFKDATSDLGGVADWWRQRPSSNIGIATGWVVDVIDIDGPEGVVSWAQMMDSLPPVLGTVCTPRPGGSHLYIAATGTGNRAGFLHHVDYRGLGGYVVAPPSYVVEKTYEGLYHWRRPLNLAAAPPPAPPPEPSSGPAGGRRRTAGQQAICARCGEPMVVIEEGQTTHPSCDLVPS